MLTPVSDICFAIFSKNSLCFAKTGSRMQGRTDNELTPRGKWVWGPPPSQPESTFPHRHYLQWPQPTPHSFSLFPIFSDLLFPWISEFSDFH
ncbi:hypothetical protein HOLleu_05547 [Holothuria leucospilota]|uniref:Uncharacterized protein n=1 Tax=Holothuria leucospilota TaxID=206669 RepID=A0A9Q1CL72_HOLLE|nr:hypothetical protein HOLleu_05547 [Holothuria leucospilota]